MFKYYKKYSYKMFFFYFNSISYFSIIFMFLFPGLVWVSLLLVNSNRAESFALLIKFCLSDMMISFHNLVNYLSLVKWMSFFINFAIPPLEIFFSILMNLYYSSWGQSWCSGTKCDCKTDWLWVRSLLEEMKYLLKFIFQFLRSGVEAKRGVEFCHSTRNASRIRKKVGNGVF